MSDQLPGALEENVLTALIWRDDIAHAVMLEVEPELFSTPEYKRIAALAIDHIERFGGPPGIHIYDKLEDLLRRSSSEAKITKRTLDQTEKLRHDLKPDFVIDSLHQFIDIRRMMNSIEAATDALDKGNLDVARQLLYTHPVMQANTPSIWLHDPEQSLAFLNHSASEFFSSGIEALDNLGIRPDRGELLLFIAPKGMGKSWFLVNIGKHGIKHGKNVVHITCEMSAQKTALRYIMAVFAMTSDETRTLQIRRFNKDRHGRMTSENGIYFSEVVRQAAVEANRADLVRKVKTLGRRGRLLIKEFPSATLTVGGLQAYLQSIEHTDKFVPDIIILDYINEMEINPGKGELRFALSRTIRQLRGLAKTRNAAFVTATQGTRKSAEATTVTATMVAEDWGMVTAADIVLTLSRTTQETAMGLARVMVAYARDKADKFIAMISQSYKSGQFCIDSVIMSQAAQAELEKLTGQGDSEDDD
jgi:KaiC/GvpD/RAD55 family RecA-like ATPase